MPSCEGLHYDARDTECRECEVQEKCKQKFFERNRAVVAGVEQRRLGLTQMIQKMMEPTPPHCMGQYNVSGRCDICNEPDRRRCMQIHNDRVAKLIEEGKRPVSMGTRTVTGRFSSSKPNISSPPSEQPPQTSIGRLESWTPNEQTLPKPSKMDPPIQNIPFKNIPFPPPTDGVRAGDTVEINHVYCSAHPHREVVEGAHLVFSERMKVRHELHQAKLKLDGGTLYKALHPCETLTDTREKDEFGGKLLIVDYREKSHSISHRVPALCAICGAPMRQVGVQSKVTGVQSRRMVLHWDPELRTNYSSKDAELTAKAADELAKMLGDQPPPPPIQETPAAPEYIRNARCESKYKHNCDGAVHTVRFYQRETDTLGEKQYRFCEAALQRHLHERHQFEYVDEPAGPDRPLTRPTVKQLWKQMLDSMQTGAPTLEFQERIKRALQTPPVRQEVWQSRANSILFLIQRIPQGITFEARHMDRDGHWMGFLRHELHESQFLQVVDTVQLLTHEYANFVEKAQKIAQDLLAFPNVTGLAARHEGEPYVVWEKRLAKTLAFNLHYTGDPQKILQNFGLSWTEAQSLAAIWGANYPLLETTFGKGTIKEKSLDGPKVVVDSFALMKGPVEPQPYPLPAVPMVFDLEYKYGKPKAEPPTNGPIEPPPQAETPFQWHLREYLQQRDRDRQIPEPDFGRKRPFPIGQSATPRREEAAQKELEAVYGAETPEQKKQKEQLKQMMQLHSDGKVSDASLISALGIPPEFMEGFKEYRPLQDLFDLYRKLYGEPVVVHDAAIWTIDKKKTG